MITNKQTPDTAAIPSWPISIQPEDVCPAISRCLRTVALIPVRFIYLLLLCIYIDFTAHSETNETLSYHGISSLPVTHPPPGPA
jgi:hypothetical protein